MRNEAHSDVLKVWLYAGASVLLGAWVTPLFYNAGKALAEVCSAKQINGPAEFVADLCRSTAFPGFFVGSLIFVAALFFMPFVEWLKGGRGRDESTGRPWGVRLPEGARPVDAGQRLVRNPQALRHALRGFLVVSALFFLIGGVLLIAGIFEWKQPADGLLRTFVRAALIAFGLAAVQEFLFRGIAMGIFLRAMRPAAALGMTALLFALVHFLKPPPGVSVVDPDASGVGFEMLRRIVSLFAEPRMLFGSFLPLVALGGVLAFARWRTASLWLSIGLHSGWIFVNSVMAAVTVYVSHPDSMMWVISGAALRQGIVPLAGILLAGLTIDYLTATDTDAAESSV